MAGLVALAALLLIVGWWLHRPKSIIDEAVRLDRAFAAGQADKLFDAASPVEIAATGLTRESFRKMFFELIWPRMGQFKPSGPILTESGMNGAEGTAYLPARDQQGRLSEFALTAYTSDQGPVVVLTPIMNGAWYMEYVIDAGLPSNNETIHAARVKGFAKDGKRLKELGITGVFDVGRGRAWPWEAINHPELGPSGLASGNGNSR